MQRLLIMGAWLMWSISSARTPDQAPPLPPLDTSFTVINVSTAQQLADACWNLGSNQAIVISPGVYDLASVNFPNGVDGRLTVGRFGASPISNIQLRGSTGNPEDVTLLGAGMLDTRVPFGIQIFTATNVTIADLSVGNVYYHAVAIQGDQGAAGVRLYHSRFFDAGQQIIKASGGNADDVVIEYSEIFYNVGALVHPEGSPPNSCYTNGIDAIGVDGWVIRDNLIRGIKCQNQAVAGPAILMWQGSSNTVVEGNTIIDSSRGVSLGLIGGVDHLGGNVRNNFIRWDPAAPYAVDVGIYAASPNASVLHNTVLTSGRYENAIEVRFADTTNVEVQHNLLDANIALRNGASASIADNQTNAEAGWFSDPPSGDLHVSPAGAMSAQLVPRSASAPFDFDGIRRSAQTLVGADEPVTILFSDGFED
ncbi:MAG: right-handed parallel beta-helix repeat-containing protein [Pseudomonadota bacterium]